MGGGISVQSNRLGRPPFMPDCFIEERLRCFNVSSLAEPEVNSLASLVHSSIQVSPLATDLDIGLIDSPGATSWPAEAIPAFDELRRIPLHPTQDGGMREVQSAFRHHFDQIAKAELVAQIPAHTQNDHLAVKVPPSKQLLDALKFAHRCASDIQRPMYPTGRGPVCTRALW